MTFRSFLFFALIATGAVLALAPTASAASANQVLNDWRADGSIDGDYSLAELRSADRQINAQEREYTFWDDAYADAVRRINNPNAPRTERPPTVPPQDFDNDGTIDAEDIKEAEEKTKELREERAEEGGEDDVPPTFDEPDEDEPTSPARDTDDDDGGAGWLLALLFLIPAAIIGFGAWRMQRAKKGQTGAAAGTGTRKPKKAKRPRRKPGSGPDAPTSSFSRGDDLP